MGIFDGIPLDYRIGTSAGSGRANRATMAPWLSDSKPALGIALLYINLFDQHRSYNPETNSGDYGPYRKPGDVADTYDEGQCDPNGDGFWRNLREQLAHGKRLGFSYCELDNRDAYDNSVILKCFDLCAEYGFHVICKNPGMSDLGEPSDQLIRHPAVVGMILEKGSVEADDIETMRVGVGLPYLILWIVTYGSGASWAGAMASQIRNRGYPNMGVTNSPNGEYTSVTDVLKPRSPDAPHPSDDDEDEPDMPDQGIPPWLATMRAISGTQEFAGGRDNPTILGWCAEIAKRFPEMTNYCRAYQHDAIPWCGLTVAYCMAMHGIKPAWGAQETDRFLWARAWAKFGDKLTTPKPGAVMVFSREGGGHVALYESTDGNSYVIRGGNQSDAVNTMRMPKSKLVAIMYPDAAVQPVPEPVPGPTPTPVPAYGRQENIIATVWRDAMGAYGPLDHSLPQVSLPAAFQRNQRPFVRVYGPSGTGVGQVTDKGPWYDGTQKRPADKYWETGQRPRAENDPRTNGAGIDLNPFMAKLVGIDGKGKVDWEFVETVEPAPAPLPVPIPEPEPEPAPWPMPATDWRPLLQDLWPIIMQNLPALIPIMIKHLPSIIPILVTYLAGTQPMERKAMTYVPPGTTVQTPYKAGQPKALVDVKPAAESKTVWLQVLGVGASVIAVLTGGQINLTPEQIIGIVLGIQTLQGIVTFVLKKWFTNTVTPASIQVATGESK